MLYLNFQVHASSRSRDRLIQFFERGAEKHVFFHRVIFIVDFEFELQIDKNFAI